MKKQAGITLIALVITIIVLLILTGVAIIAISGNGQNIIKKSKRTVEQYNNSVPEEQETINAYKKYLKKYSSLIPLKGKANIDENGLAAEDILIQPDSESNLQIVIPEGFAPAVLAGNGLPGTDGSVVSILPANQWKNITSEQINKGIVIVDNTITYDGGQSEGTVPDFNEFVWVPIPESGKFSRIAWMNSRTNLRQPLAETSTVDCWWEDKTSSEYTNMVFSITKYKGFYIGRYESSNNGSNVAQSKRNQTVWGNVAQTTAITASSNNEINENMHLIYGIEWDSTLNWLIDNAIISSSTPGETKTMEISNIQSNSTSWGNYRDSTGDATTNSYSKQTTGYSEYWKANNIYDLAGNVWEWTQEKYSTGIDKNVRGGYYNYYGNRFHPVAVRDTWEENYENEGIRFQNQLFLIAKYLKRGTFIMFNY